MWTNIEYELERSDKLNNNDNSNNNNNNKGPFGLADFRALYKTTYINK